MLGLVSQGGLYHETKSVMILAVVVYCFSYLDVDIPPFRQSTLIFDSSTPAPPPPQPGEAGKRSGP
ncbi:MAG: hypothetical protein R3E08_07515 [Thiotrichaceae bacterium]